MTDPRSPIRTLRAALFAAVCVTLAAVGHSVMSAHDIPPGSLVAAFAVTGLLAWLGGARRRGAPVIGIGLLAVQGALHLAFGSGGAHHGHTGMTPGPAAAPGTTTGMAPDASAASPAMLPHPADPAAMADMAGMAGLTADLPAAHQGLGASSTGMLAAHLLAAAVCALWLARGEAAFFRLAAAVCALAFSPLRRLLLVVRLPDAPRPPRPSAPAVRRHHGVVLAHTLSRRGPPLCPVPRVMAPGAVI
ncbi:hypothetical protein [Streptomyces sp. SP18CS02]|uniref:hypothetical protein n=1 Tax=Streptomyces sp. SP18CS02 TaxID=3002531 RepID=UPI002E78E081|nr:hypothetical protein [Streptomyces sp. SP18CS02]MEE1755193.1 hypothetical protein [Streptomyces sp. SP18CS02]